MWNFERAQEWWFDVLIGLNLLIVLAGWVAYKREQLRG